MPTHGPLAEAAKNQNESIYAFAHDYTGVILFICASAVGLMLFLWKENNKLKTDRRVDAQRAQDEHIQALHDLVTNQADTQQQILNSMGDMSREFSASIRQTSEDFRISLESINEQLNKTASDLHEKINPVVDGLSKLQSEHNVMMKICPATHKVLINRQENGENA